MAVLRKLVPDRTDRLKYACMVIIAANAGGSWSPIGDVTTILLWVGKNISAMHQISHAFIPALVNMLVPLTIAHFWFVQERIYLACVERGGARRRVHTRDTEPLTSDDLCDRRAFLALVPVFQMVTNFAAVLGRLA